MPQTMRINWDQRAMDRILKRSTALRRMITGAGESGVRFAKGIAPDQAPIGRGYVEGLQFQYVSNGHRGLPEGRIVSTDFKTWWVEKGTQPHPTRPGGALVSMPAQHVLARTLAHIRR